MAIEFEKTPDPGKCRIEVRVFGEGRYEATEADLYAALRRAEKAEAECERLREEADKIHADRVRLADENRAMRPVVEEAKKWRDRFGKETHNIPGLISAVDTYRAGEPIGQPVPVADSASDSVADTVGPTCIHCGGRHLGIVCEVGHPELRDPPTDGAPERALCIVFDGQPRGDRAPRFVECEVDGQSVRAGEWHKRSDGLWELRIHHEAAVRQALEKAAERVCAEVKATAQTVGESNHLTAVSFVDEWLCTRGSNMATANFVDRLRAGLRSAILQEVKP